MFDIDEFLNSKTFVDEYLEKTNRELRRRERVMQSEMAAMEIEHKMKMDEISKDILKEEAPEFLNNYSYLLDNKGPQIKQPDVLEDPLRDKNQLVLIINNLGNLPYEYIYYVVFWNLVVKGEKEQFYYATELANFYNDLKKLYGLLLNSDDNCFYLEQITQSDIDKYTKSHLYSFSSFISKPNDSFDEYVDSYHNDERFYRIKKLISLEIKESNYPKYFEKILKEILNTGRCCFEEEFCISGIEFPNIAFTKIKEKYLEK